ncbi:hypothetical protein CerSpe_086300 [Prunus speciosa]
MDSYFRFLPTEEELVSHYLREKKQVDHIIPEIDICKHEPWDVPGLYAGLFTEPESPYQDMFFFSPRVYKYNNSARIERTTALGFWKITGKERVIKARGSTGRKKTLTFMRVVCVNRRRPTGSCTSNILLKMKPTLILRWPSRGILFSVA